MSEIPDDIIQTAAEIVDRIAKQHVWKGDCVADVAQALFSERHRHAEVMEALREFMDITESAATPAFRDPDYANEVQALGDRIGYGALISSASASWRESLARDGYPTGGEFVVGPCMAVLLLTRAKASALLSRLEER